MSVEPKVISVSPAPGCSGVVLRQPIVVTVSGAVDPASWSDATFAVYGPGDIVTDTGPGTVLNESGVFSSPYRLIDGATVRARISGSFSVAASGTNSVLTFAPANPLDPSTIYEAVLLGSDADAVGLVSWTSSGTFALSGTAGASPIAVAAPYSRTSRTTLYDPATGHNDVYTVTVVSGALGPTWTWSQASAPTDVYPFSGRGTFRLGNDLQIAIDPSGAYFPGDVYTLDVYVPVPLSTTAVWSFVTSELDAATPPTVPTPGPIVVDVNGGGLVVSPAPSIVANPLRVVATYPENLEYAVPSGLQAIVIQFNKDLRQDLVVSGIITAADVPIILSPLLGLPNVYTNPSFVPSGLEVSGAYLKIWL